jgi:hypothetical protein
MNNDSNSSLHLSPEVAAHIESKQREAQAAERENDLRREVMRARSAAAACGRHGYPTDQLENGQRLDQFAQRCDWGEYARGWVRDAWVPLVRELERLERLLGENPVYEPRALREVTTGAKLQAIRQAHELVRPIFTRVWESGADEGEVARAVAAMSAVLTNDPGAWLHYHAYFNALEGAIGGLARPKRQSDVAAPPSSAPRAKMDPDEARLDDRLGGGEGAERAKCVLRVLREGEGEWVADSIVRRAGLPTTTALEYMRKHCPDDVKGGQRDGGPVSYRRRRLVQYVVGTWRPRALRRGP